MPKNSKQILAVVVLGGLAALAGGIAVDLTGQSSGAPGFLVQVGAGAAGAALGLAVLNGKGARLA